MGYEKLRKELSHYYLDIVDEKADNFCIECENVINSLYKENMSVFEEKVLQYKTITEMMEPVVFLNSPFYFETGTMCAECDGARDWRKGHSHPGGWVFRKNSHKFVDQNPELWELKKAQASERFYLICGPYNDVSQHFTFNYRPVFEMGLKGIYQKAKDGLKDAKTKKEQDYLNATCEGLLCLKKISEKFADKANEILVSSPDSEIKKNMEMIVNSAKCVPWEKPESFYEALNTYAFLRKTIGALEGVGFNTFGRVDLDLYPFYEKDIKNGTLTKDEAYDLIVKFLLGFDLVYDHDMKMELYSDHEMENTYTLGGCDIKGNPVWNDLTKMFLTATREEKIIFPKIKCRFSKNSPKEYLDEINKSIIAGTSTILYQNDDACIPSLVRSGKTLEESREYIVSGCWDMVVLGKEKEDQGAYVNLLKPFEYSIHNLTEKMKKVGMTFKPLDNAKNFEEVYNITMENIDVLLKERARITREGGSIWDSVDVLPLFSSTLDNCIESKKDYTSGGAKYKDDSYLCFGLPNIVDSLLAIKTLCFDEKKYTLKEYLNAVRANYEGYEDLRQAALKCHGWGDGNSDSNLLAKKFNDDIYKALDKLTGTYGGKVKLGYLTYTEIRWWGEQTLATPDGRKNGDYFAQGLTPSRLKKIPAVTSVINSLSVLDKTTLAGNSVVNIILPAGKTTLDICEAFLRASADTALQSLQLNCTSKEQLLDAQKHPENYQDLIVRVTGFSARFTALSPEWQNEVLTRNFYE